MMTKADLTAQTNGGCESSTSSSTKSYDSKAEDVRLFGLRVENEEYSKLQELEIGGNQVKQFDPAILSCSEFKVSKSREFFQATFFDGSPFKTVVRAIAFTSSDDIYPGMSKAILIKTPNAERGRQLASEHLRRSSTLQNEASERIALTTSLYTDNRGFAYVSNDRHREQQFERLMLVSMLAQAYASIQSSFSRKLSESIRIGIDYTDCTELYEQMITFDAGYFMRHPIPVDRHELKAAWDRIFDHLRLGQQRSELHEQLSSYAMWMKTRKDADDERARHAENIAEEKARKATERREKRINLILTFIAILLAFLAVPQFWDFLANLPGHLSYISALTTVK